MTPLHWFSGAGLKVIFKAYGGNLIYHYLIDPKNIMAFHWPNNKAVDFTNARV